MKFVGIHITRQKLSAVCEYIAECLLSAICLVLAVVVYVVLAVADICKAWKPKIAKKLKAWKKLLKSEGRKVWREQRSYRKYVAELDLEAQKSRPPTPPLRRILTLCVTPSGDIESGLSSKGAEISPLFSRTNFDIRRLIYLELLGKEVIHVVRKGKRLAHLLCEAELPRTHDTYGCWGFQNDDGTFFVRCTSQHIPSRKLLEYWTQGDWRGSYKTDGVIMQLLLICRQVYSEVASITYESRTFSFNNMAHFQLFRSLTPPHRLNSIRSLHIQLLPFNKMVADRRAIMTDSIAVRPPTTAHSFPAESDWTSLWASVAEMRGLEKLQVQLKCTPLFMNRRLRLAEEGGWIFIKTNAESSDREASWSRLMVDGPVSRIEEAYPNAEVDDALLDPLRAIKGINKFVVELPPELNRWQNYRTDDPFELSFYSPASPS